jgi:hypothetical protein
MLNHPCIPSIIPTHLFIFCSIQFANFILGIYISLFTNERYWSIVLFLYTDFVFGVRVTPIKCIGKFPLLCFLEEILCNWC